MNDSTHLAGLMEPIARTLLGEPNRNLSSKKQLRYGSHGSLCVDLEKGTWFDHEANEGGGVLDLVTRETKLDGAERAEWISKFENGAPAPKARRLVATYDYSDEAGTVLFQVVRYDPKDFRQRRPDGKGDWIWNVEDVRPVPYRLPEVINTIANQRVIFVVEGEKDADNLQRIGIPATTNAGGCGKWKDALSQFFRDADVVIIGDHDPQKRHPKTGEPMFHDDGRPVLPGQDHAQNIAAKLQGIAKRVRVIELAEHWKQCPAKADASDWLAAGGAAEALWEIVDGLPDWKPDSKAEQQPSSLPFINMSKWDSEPVPEQQWTVLNRIPRRQCALFSGEGAVGKSTIQLHLSAAHVLARDWLGTMPEPGPALFIDAEDDIDVLHRRLAAITRHYDLTFTDLIKGGLHVISLAGHDAVLATTSRSGKVEPTPLYKQILEVAGDIKPVMIGIASSANVYAGSEIDRNQVQQFIGLLTRLAITANGSVALISHPSLTGISTDTGLSGNTQWHNAVRARFYLKAIKAENGEEADSDLREIVFKKNNYGPVSESIVLRYTEGLFLPVRGMTTLERAAREADADVIAFQQIKSDQMNLSNNPHAGNYAPRVFAKSLEAKKHKLTEGDFEAAMQRLIAAGKIKVERYGRPSDPRYRLVLATEGQ